MEKKKFVAFWSAGAFVTPDGKDEIKQFEGTDFFTDERGYDEDDIEAINELGIGAMWQDSNYGHYHWVVRTE